MALTDGKGTVVYHPIKREHLWYYQNTGGKLGDSSPFTSQNNTAIILGAGVLIAGLMIYLSRPKGRRK